MRRPNGQQEEIWRTSATGKPVRNRILLSLPEPEYLLIRPHLEFIPFRHQHILHEPNKELRFAYFLNSGLISLMIETGEGKTVEVGVVGNDGMAGIPSAVGLDRSPLREVVQVAGDGFRVKVPALQSALRLDSILSRGAEPVRHTSMFANGPNRRLQQAPQCGATARAVALDGSSQIGVRFARHYT